MSAVTNERHDTRFTARLATLLAGAIAAGSFAGCAYQSTQTGMATAPAAPAAAPTGLQVDPPTPDPRVGLAPGMFDAGEAIWNLDLVSTTPPPDPFVGQTNSDLAFSGPYAIQGNYDGIQIWDISDPANPVSVVTYVCPASQSDVSVYESLLFVSGEGFGGRLDCGDQGVEEAVSHDRLRGIRIFDISDITAPEYVANVQTCRGSHTHTLLEHPGDDENVYIYVSGSAPVRPEEELAGCSGAPPAEDPNTALFRIEVIRVPLADPASAAVVSSPRIFEDLVAPPTHGLAPDDIAAIEAARERGAFIIEVRGQEMVLPEQAAQQMLGQFVAQRGGEGAPTAADSAALREALPSIVAQMMGPQGDGDGPEPGPTQCHDITVYPAIGLAGGACEGYGMLLDISDPENPRRLSAVADSNFSYWHSATFNNDGSAILFTDEWGGGGAPKCRASDPMEWGANAIFTIEGTEMEFQSYFKLPAPQTPEENCVAHNGSLIPIPGRDIMIQGWYQGGISLLDWTDPTNPAEIAYFDRGPVNPDRMQMGGSWSVYWYNGVIVNSEIARGLDILELTPSEALTRNEIDAANSVQLTHLNSQGQPIFEWPATFALARAYLDQLERQGGLSADRIGVIRAELSAAEAMSGSGRSGALRSLADDVSGDAGRADDAAKVGMLADAIRALAGAGM
ncbi:LVIVD repeat-containing protein [Candidatus Palauibacter sp.]|uniref:LVIVD repeat-containing protein n=1 Tax=Candidatus Palauibacter sp. TaxID=3101350 RepID=UPI003B528154